MGKFILHLTLVGIQNKNAVTTVSNKEIRLAQNINFMK